MRELFKRYDIIVVVLLFLLALPAQRFEWFSAVEDQTTSFRHVLRAKPNFPANIVFVNTDEAFFKAYKSWPLRRTDIARIVTNLRALGAKVVGVDNLFDFPNSYGEDDETAAMFHRAGNVVVVSAGIVDQNGKLTRMHYAVAPIKAVTTTGYSNVESASRVVESISRIKVYPEARHFEGGWPFAVQVLAKYLDATPVLEDRVLRIGDNVTVALDFNNTFRIDFPAFEPGERSYSQSPFHGVGALEVLDLSKLDAERLQDLKDLIAGKIVLVGDTSEVSHDYFPTPLGAGTYGVEIIGATIDTLQRNAPLHLAPQWLEAVIAFMLMGGLIATAFVPRPGMRIAIAAAEFAMWFGAAIALYWYFGVIVSMSYVMIAGTLSFLTVNLRYYLQERNQKALIRDAFGQYLSPKVVSILVQDPTRLSLGGERRDMTAFFSDLAGFSTISEQLSPEGLVALLNEYLTSMCDIIAEYDGTVDKFEGDAIIAFWGAPLDQPDHARLGCLATIDMQRYMLVYRKRLMERGQPLLNMRVGLNTGAMLVGNLGSKQRMDYTIMGDAVNLAARLEGANKQYRTYTMISEHTYRHVQDVVDVRELDRIRVVGKREAVTVYELLERKGYLPASMQELIVIYQRGLHSYRGGDFRAALAHFERAHALDARDGPTETYIARCIRYIDAPPASDWDGVFELASK